MVVHASPKPKPPAPPVQPADLIREWAPMLKRIDPNAELDFSFAQDAITICDMRVPNALRYGVLYGRRDIQEGLHKVAGDFERRVREFMR